MIVDHYAGESQTLTSGAEQNMLKLAELRGRLAGAQAQRWAEIKRGFARKQSLGGDEQDPVTRVTGQLHTLGEKLATIALAVGEAGGIGASLERLTEKVGDTGQVQAQLRGIADAIASSGDNVEAWSTLVARIEALMARLAAQKMREAPVPRARTARPMQPPTAIAAELAPRMQSLEQALLALANPRLEVTLKTPPAMEELLGQQVAIVERTLIPLVRVATERLGDTQQLEASIRQLLLSVRTDGGGPAVPPRRG